MNRIRQLVNLIITIILGIAAEKEESIGMNDYLNLWKQGDKKVDGIGLENDELVAAATFNLLKERNSENERYKALGDIFDKGADE